jgi:hypothetical protein
MSKPGSPGKPGKPAEGSVGGTGGEGGVGGAGQETGGAGGTGGVGGSAAGKELKTGLRNLALATIALFLCVVGLGIWFYLDSREAHKALCSLRQDVEARRASSTKYLDDVAEGRRKPISGLTQADVRVSITNQDRTIRALSNLDC